MPFLTLDSTIVASGSASPGFAIFFSPAPPEATLPGVWLDLHVGGDDYQACEDEHARRPFKKDADGKLSVRIRPHRSIRLTTAERVGVDVQHTALVVNVASRAKHGLIVAPGKVDPGFNPAPLLLVVHNQSNRLIKLRTGDKIAAIAFARLSASARPTESSGHALAPLGGDFEPRFGLRLTSWLAERDWPSMTWDLAKAIITAFFTLLTAYVIYRSGWRPR